MAGFVFVGDQHCQQDRASMRATEVAGKLNLKYMVTNPSSFFDAPDLRVPLIPIRNINRNNVGAFCAPLPTGA